MNHQIGIKRKCKYLFSKKHSCDIEKKRAT